MKVYRIPVHVSAILFDIDSTLYTDEAYAGFQNDVLVGELARTRGMDFQQALLETEKARVRWAERNGAGRTSLGNAFLELGIPIATSVAWRERLIQPAEWLDSDAALAAALGRLAARFRLAAVTNNPRSVGRAALEALGVSAVFRVVVGLDDTMVSKPSREPFELAIKLLGTDAGACVSIGDRYDVDLAVPLGLGCGAVLVDGVGDVYALPGLFGV
ncbi:MAG: HAD family hydrolase [Spirochaetes bacterium]|nr:HAD family hydrolase [Spirochaetota bacterium]